MVTDQLIFNDRSIILVTKSNTLVLCKLFSAIHRFSHNHNTTAVDLLPPGGDFLNEQAEAAASYLRGVVEGLNAADEHGTDLGYDLIVLLGGRVASAFCASDSRLHDMRLLQLRNMDSYNVVILPSPHTNETTGDGWWSSPEKQGILRDAVTGWLGE